MKEQIMLSVLTFASALGVFVIALMQLVKITVKLPKTIVPLIGFLVGLLIGAVAYPFTDLDIVLRLWAGGLAGLSATGLFEMMFNRRTGSTPGVTRKSGGP